MIAETVARYSGLLTIERLHGPEGVRAFLQRELNLYLAARANHDVPLTQVRSQADSGVWYHKGALVMYALHDAIRAATPPDQQGLLTDLFNTIPPWDTPYAVRDIDARPDSC